MTHDILPAYVPQRRWFGSKDEAISDVTISRLTPFPETRDLMLAEIEVTTPSGTARYTLPLGIVWEGEQPGRFASALALARVRRGRNVGLLTDGFALTGFPEAVLTALNANATVPMEGGALRFTAHDGLDIAADIEPRWLSAEQSNSSMLLGDQAVLKLLRKITPGIHPEVEMVSHLTAQGFANVPPILGEVRLEEGGETSLVMLVQRYVHNQGDGWEWTLGVLERLATDIEASHENYENFACHLGGRLAEMHAILAKPSDDPAFAPEPMTAQDCTALADRVTTQFDVALGLLADMDDEDARMLRDRRDAIVAAIHAVTPRAEGMMRTRIHGDLHLGQMLVTGSDVMLIDFEGEPARPLAERRAKDLPLRDVAGVVRSFDYASAVARRALPAGADTEEARTAERYAEFRDRADALFLSGYSGKPDDKTIDPLLDVFLLEKAAYEVAYEAANRPDWIVVPVSGLARAAGRLLNREQA